MDLNPINLQKPLGSDVYNIEVFNNNSTTIEQAINNVIYPFIGELAPIFNFKLVTYRDYSTTEIDIDDNSGSIMPNCAFMKINRNFTTGTYPSEDAAYNDAMLLNLITSTNGKLVWYQWCFPVSGKGTYYRRAWDSNNSTWSAWNDDLITEVTSSNTNTSNRTISYNTLVGLFDSCLHIQNVDSSGINIDDLNIELLVVSKNISTNTGTFPSGASQTDFSILCYSNGQMFMDATTSKVYTRSYISSNWSDWLDISNGGGGSGESNDGIDVNYPTNSIDIDTISSGIYICKYTTTVTGTLPESSYDQFILITYGDYTDNIKSQTYINAKTGAIYSRNRYSFGESSSIYEWTNWKSVNTGITFTVVDL